MKLIKHLLIIVLLLIFLYACTPIDDTEDPVLTYQISINQTVSKEIFVGDEIDFKLFFIIRDSDNNAVEVLDEMIDSSDFNSNKTGAYQITIVFNGLEERITITVVERPITYTITINESKSTTIELNNTSVDFRDYFVISDSNGDEIEVLLSMLDLSSVNLSTPGAYVVTITYQNVSEALLIVVVDNAAPLTFKLSIDSSLPTTFSLGTTSVDFKEYFSIESSSGDSITITDDMLDLTYVSFNKLGEFDVVLTYLGDSIILTIEIIEPEFMYATDLFFSEYSEGASYNKYIEIFNGTGEDVDLSVYALKLFNFDVSNSAQYTYQLSGTLKDGDTYIVYHQQANSTIKASGDVSDVVTNFNGNDPIALYKNDVLIDVVGDLSKKVSDAYDIDELPKATMNQTIIRKSNVFGPSATWNPSEWQALGLEVFTDMKKHVMDFYQPNDDSNPSERTPDLYISEYFEGVGEYNNSKYIEIYNELGYDVDLSDYALNLYSNGEQTPSYTQALTGTLKNKEVFIVYAPYSAQEIIDLGHLSSEVAFFNGRQAIALTKNGELLDVFGVIGEYPSSDGWIVDTFSGTANNTLIRHYDVNSPTITWDSGEWYVCYENYLYDLGLHKTDYEDVVIENFDILFNLIKNLELNDKGTSLRENTVTIKGTVYMDVKNETTLVYITDGKNFIKLHGDKIHNYTAPNQVYEVTGIYKAFLYQPTFEVINPNADIKSLNQETPITKIITKLVTLQEIVSLQRVNFVQNINNGYLQSMLQVSGYLQYDTHNSNRYDYALTINETYTKNHTQYINNGLYFKNDVRELEDFLIDYEVVVNGENVVINIFGVIYDWNPDRSNWRIYVSDTLTFEYLMNQ